MVSFHQLAVMQQALYKHYRNKRKQKGFTDVTVILPGSAQQVFEGRHYNYKYL